MCSVGQKPVFQDLSAEDAEPEVTEIESLCMNCHSNGVTRLLLTRIPYYRNVIIMSFSCEHCGFENNEIQPGGAFAERGVRWKLRVEQQEDLNRTVVKSDYTSIRIPEVDLEIPAQSQKGEVTTVEGVVERAAAGLAAGQPARRAAHPAAAAQLDDFLARLHELRALARPWTLELEDASGNSFVENPRAPHRDPRCERTDFVRDAAQDRLLGIRAPAGGLPAADPALAGYEQLAAEEVLQFRTNCPACDAPADTNMKLTRIPHFKEVVIMATSCDACGHRTNEVKSGGGVEDAGVRFEVRVAGSQDFSRDVLKSETCSMAIPELELEVGGRALGGRFTTAEGLLRATADQLAARSGAAGDAPALCTASLDRFLEQLAEVLAGRRSVTLVLDDPAGNSYVQSLAEDGAPDDGLKVTRYERSFEQNEELGLNDMKTEGYEQE